MKNHELLDMIGEVNEDYVLAAESNVTRPRFRWKTLAACAACAALVLAAYPVYRAVNPPLHGYTVEEGGGVLDTQGDVKAPMIGEDVPAPDPVPDVPLGGDAVGYDVPGQDAPVQEAAQAQYDGLLRGLGGEDVTGYGTGIYPNWFGGAWIDNDYYPEARLRVAIVDGLRTAELEAKIQDWCGGGVVFQDVKYSQSYLDGLMLPVTKALDGTGLACGIGVDVMENRLGVDIFGEAVPDAVLAELARLDPAGDAIRVRVFVGSLALTDDLVKGPALEEPAVDPDVCPTPSDGSEYGFVEDFHPDYDPTFEDGLPANHDVIPEGE